MHGDGVIFQLKGRTTWRAQYCCDGKRYVGNAPTELAAKRLLQGMRAKAARGTLLDAPARRATFEDMVQLLKDDYVRKQNRSLDRALIAVAHLERVFARVPVHRIGYAEVAHYIATRLQGEKEPDGTVVRRVASHGTVAQERAILGRMLTLAMQCGYIAARPRLPEVGGRDNARQGFFSDEEFGRVHDELPAHLRPIMRFLWLTGWRAGEALTLTWSQVDLCAGELRLAPRHSKNREPRVFPYAALPPLATLIGAQREYTSRIERERGMIVSAVFHRSGRPIRSYLNGWRAACDRACVPGKLVHDLRRTAVRRLERAGVPRSVSMRLTGHKTESVYRRYAIVAPADLDVAGARIAAQLLADAAAPPWKSGTEVVPRVDIAADRPPRARDGNIA